VLINLQRTLQLDDVVDEPAERSQNVGKGGQQLQNLRPMLKIVITSNFDASLETVLSDLGIQRINKCRYDFEGINGYKRPSLCIDGLFLSGELGVQKPHPIMFGKVAEKFNLQDSPNAILHVGDR
jgi:hypothetical protein